MVWDVGCQRAHQLGGSGQGDINKLQCERYEWGIPFLKFWRYLIFLGLRYRVYKYKEYLNEILTTHHEHQNSCLEDLNIHDMKPLERIVCGKRQIIPTFEVVSTSHTYSKSSFRYQSRTIRSYNTMAPDTTLSPSLITSLIEELVMCSVFHLLLAETMAKSRWGHGPQLPLRHWADCW